MSEERRIKVGPDNVEIVPLIPEVAVHAAAEAVYGCGFDGSPQKEAWLADFHKALTAAMPHMLADVWRQGYLAGLAGMEFYNSTPNPYRSNDE